MPRARRKKTSDVPTRIYSYRCLPPIIESDRVEQQFQLAHQYRNALVEIERRLRDQLREVQLADPIVGDLLRRYEDTDAAVENAYDDLRAKKSGVADPDLSTERDHLEIVKELRAAFGEELRAAKTERSAQLAPGYTASREKAVVERKAARHDFIDRGLRTGTYDRVENSIKQAVKTARRPLHFERYDGTGSIGTQLIETSKKTREMVARSPDDRDSWVPIDLSKVRGMTVAELLSCQDPRLRLGAPGAEDAHPRPEVDGLAWSDVSKLGRNLRRHAARTYVDLRVGSKSDRSPIFARFPVTLHRPLPKDAVIKWAYVVRKRVGRHYEWRFQFTIESETFRPCPVAIGEGACAIDLGWRRLFDDDGNQVGLRVGYVVDETGREREILAPDHLVSGMAKVYDIAAIRDKEFDAARDRLVAWLGDRATPEWMSDRVAGLAQWRAPKKLAALVDAWAGIDWNAWRASRATGKKCNPSDFSSTTNRVDGDKTILSSLQSWARQDRHLQNWEEHQRDRLIAHRRETWRVVAAELTGRYATILIENGKTKFARSINDRDKLPEIDGCMKLPDIEGWERPAPEDGDPSDGRDQRRMSRLAAPGELRAEILKAAPKRGAHVEVEETADSTRECAWCSAVEPFDAATSVKHCCSSCDRIWDQDANACRNLLHRRGLSSGPVPPTPAEVLAEQNVASRRGSFSAGASAVLDRVK
jgi:hypothetical protein